MLRPTPALAVAPLVVLAAAPLGCRYAVHHVRDLPYQRTVELELDGNELDRFEVESHSGDVRIVRTRGAGRLRVEVHERAPDLAQVWLDGGTLRMEALDEDDAYIGDVTLEVAEILGDVVLGVGAGEVGIEDVPVGGEIAITVGAGDVNVIGVGTPRRVAISTGAGDATVRAVDAVEVELSSGAGDLTLVGVWCDRAVLDSGVGTLRVDGSTIGDLEADAGIGDILLSDTQCERESLSTGLGSVEY